MELSSISSKDGLRKPTLQPSISISAPRNQTFLAGKSSELGKKHRTKWGTVCLLEGIAINLANQLNRKPSTSSPHAHLLQINKAKLSSSKIRDCLRRLSRRFVPSIPTFEVCLNMWETTQTFVSINRQNQRHE